MNNKSDFFETNKSKPQPKISRKMILIIVGILLLLLSIVLVILFSLNIMSESGTLRCIATKPFGIKEEFQFDPNTYDSLDINLGGYVQNSSIRFERHSSDLIVIDKKLFAGDRFDINALKAYYVNEDKSYKFTINDGRENTSGHNQYDCFRADLTVKIPKSLNIFSYLRMDVYRTDIDLDFDGKLNIDDLKLSVIHGNVKIINSNVKVSELTVRHGDLVIKDSRINSSIVKSHLADIKYFNSTLSNIKLENSHGNVIISNSKLNEIKIDCEHGDIKLNVGGTKKVQLKNSHGDINIEVNDIQQDVKDVSYEIRNSYGDTALKFTSLFDNNFFITNNEGSAKLNYKGNKKLIHILKDEEGTKSGSIGEDQNGINQIKIQNDNEDAQLSFL
ncbi:hypothetical protein K502DRAFT_354360 [Neoconidiobolus thromboides FSU 785]|nr:hypothetical protein K502DRAFT_354360 [Neoconidiobolus thromboides FSU 785]